MYCVNDKNKSVTDAQILVNNRFHILRNIGTKQAYNYYYCAGISKGAVHILYNAKNDLLLTIFSISKENPSPYITHITNCQPLPFCAL